MRLINLPYFSSHINLVALYRSHSIYIVSGYCSMLWALLLFLLQLMHFPPGPSQAGCTRHLHANVLKMDATMLWLNPDISSLTFLWKGRAEEYWSWITVEQNRPLATVARNLSMEQKHRCGRSGFRESWSYTGLQVSTNTWSWGCYQNFPPASTGWDGTCLSIVMIIVLMVNDIHRFWILRMKMVPFSTLCV